MQDKPHGLGKLFKASDNSYKEGNWNMGVMDNHWQVSGAKVRGNIQTDPYKKYNKKNFSSTNQVIGASTKLKTRTRLV